MSEALERNGHSIFSASGSPIWINCSGALRANLDLPDTAGRDAAWGTVFHTVMQEWLESGEMPELLLGATLTAEAGGEKYSFVVDDEMMANAKACIDWITPIQGERFIETKVLYDDLTPIPKQGGTCDLAIINGSTLYIRDWKHGTGVQVFVATDEWDQEYVDTFGDILPNFINSQFGLYGYGFFRKYDHIYHFEKISLGVAQPRLEHFEELTITRNELLAFAAYAKERAYAAWEIDAPRTPSKKACRFCKVVLCPALEATRRKLYVGRFSDITDAVTTEEMSTALTVVQTQPEILPSYETMLKPARFPTEDLLKIRGYRKVMEKYFKEVEAELLFRANEGQPIPGHKMVEGRSWKKFTDEAAACAFLVEQGLDEDEINPRRMLSANALLPILRTRLGLSRKNAVAFLQPLMYNPPGRPTLVPSADPRPVYEGVVYEGRFTDLTEPIVWDDLEDEL